MSPQKIKALLVVFNDNIACELIIIRGSMDNVKKWAYSRTQPTCLEVGNMTAGFLCKIMAPAHKYGWQAFENTAFTDLGTVSFTCHRFG